MHQTSNIEHRAALLEKQELWMRVKNIEYRVKTTELQYTVAHDLCHFASTDK
jgi:hypothetical protein